MNEGGPVPSGVLRYPLKVGEVIAFDDGRKAIITGSSELGLVLSMETEVWEPLSRWQRFKAWFRR